MVHLSMLRKLRPYNVITLFAHTLYSTAAAIVIVFVIVAVTAAQLSSSGSSNRELLCCTATAEKSSSQQHRTKCVRTPWEAEQPSALCLCI